METDYYKILGVKRNASEDEITKAYRKCAMKYHPDRQSGKSEQEKKDAETMFKQCSEAYETLSDSGKRANYDRFGNSNGFQGGFGGHNFDPREFFRRHMGGFSVFDDFGDFGGFGFGGGMGRTEDDSMAPRDGKTVRLQAKVSFEDMIYGSKKTFDISLTDTCEHCHGTGSEDGKYNNCPTCGGSGMVGQRHGMMFMQSTCPACHGIGRTISKPCSICHGSKTVPSQRHLEINISKGTQNGETIVLKEKGIKGFNGGKDGDVEITLVQEKHDIFERDGMDLLTTITIPSLRAALGGDVQVQTPWGKKTLSIPSGTQSKKTFRIEGFGVRSPRGNGNLYVVVDIENIRNLTEQQKKILSDLERTLSDKNYENTAANNRKTEEFENMSRKLRDS